MKLKSVSFFCPAYYDEKNLPDLIKDAVNLLEEVAEKYEIIIVEDGSPDDTGKVADELAKTYEHVKVIHHEKNKGYGEALKTGFKTAKYDWIIYTDGDHQYNIFDFKKLLAYANEYDAITGYRQNYSITPFRRIQSKIFNTLVTTLGSINLKDINCSIKIYRKKVIDAMEIESSSAFIDAEMLVKAKKLGFKIKEVPVQHYPRLHGQASGAKPKVVINTFKDLVNQLILKK